MALRDRIKKLESRHEPEGCSACEKRITVVRPGDPEPDRDQQCLVCGQSPPGGVILRVVYEGSEHGA